MNSGPRAKIGALGPYGVPFTDDVPGGPFAAALRGAARRRRGWVRSKRRAARVPSPSVDLVGPKAEATLKAWLEVVDYEPPVFLAAWDTDETTMFLLSGFIPGDEPLPGSEHEASGHKVEFAAETGWIETLRGLERRISATVTGPATPRLLPSRFAQADGVLVPVGFNPTGTLHLPLLGPALAVGGRDAGELLRSLVIFAAARLGRGALRALSAIQLTSLLEAAGEIDTLAESQEAAVELFQRELEARRQSFWDKVASNFREHALIRRGDNHPVLLVALDDSPVPAITIPVEDQFEDGIAAVILNESKPARRSVAVAKSRCRIDPGFGLGSLTLTAPILPPDALVEVAQQLRVSGPPVSAAGLPAHVERVGFVSNAQVVEAPVRGAPDAPEGIGAERAAERPWRDETTPVRRIYVLGRPRVELDGQEIEARLRQKSLELVALLAPHEDGLVKDAVLETLWPEGDPEKSDANLRQCLSDIRKHLGYVRGADMVIERVGELLRLDKDGVWTDVAGFSTAIEAAASSDEPSDDLSRAVDLYRGEFCQGVYSWSEPIREHLRRLFIDAAVRLSDILAERGELDAAIEILDRAVAADRYVEHVYRRAMVLESKRGRRDGVVRRFRSLERLLSDDLQVSPEGETVALFRSLTG